MELSLSLSFINTLFRKKNTPTEVPNNQVKKPLNNKQANNKQANNKQAKTSKTQNKPSQSPHQNKSNWQLSQFKVPKKEGKTRFHDLNLETELLHAIYDLGFSYCTPIQAESLPATLTGHDVIGQAQTGTNRHWQVCCLFINYFKLFT